MFDTCVCLCVCVVRVNSLAMRFVMGIHILLYLRLSDSLSYIHSFCRLVFFSKQMCTTITLSVDFKYTIEMDAGKLKTILSFNNFGFKLIVNGFVRRMIFLRKSSTNLL